MITKEDLERWYDAGKKTPEEKEKIKKELSEVLVSLMKVKASFGQMKFEKVKHPKNWKVRDKDEWLEIITGKSFKPSEWTDLKTKSCN